FAGISPVAILFTRWAYVALGGSPTLGPGLASMVRLLLAILVLGLPTFLMGGTLPAVARAVEQGHDRSRRSLGLLYGANTMGAVLGSLVTTFLSIELLGIRQTIWTAALINILIALAARAMSRSQIENDSTPIPEARSVDDRQAAAGPNRGGEQMPAWLVPLAAGVVGFCFFLLELVWYRMLAPVLGGSSYTFGLILAMALLGIGIGGLLYSGHSHRRRPDLMIFSLTCSLEAVLVIAPFALGDRLAFLAKVLRDLSGLGFGGLVLSWSLVTAIVVLPAAVVAGYQFPLLVAILGGGRQNVGKQVGQTYAWNTLGAIAGSLAGGFGLIPLLSAPGAWRSVAVILVLLAVVSLGFGRRPGERHTHLVLPLATALMTLLLCATPGPSAFWRHSPIGAGRLQIEIRDPNELEDAIRYRNRVVLWEIDGRESSVSLQAEDGLSFFLNGKSDGHARTDAPTQVMSGILGALLSPEPRRALVIGLGTGSTAGWLAEVPTIERVEVVELEPAICKVAEACGAVNHQVLDHPKVDLTIGDAREVLVTSSGRFDVIFSEPSNPYRAGISSLFSQDFYRAVVERLENKGIFIQWLQGYDVDGEVVRTAIATLRSVFGSVETWSVHKSDLLLVASRNPLAHDIETIRRRLEVEPYRSALSFTWGVEGVEGLFSGFVASDAFSSAVAEAAVVSVNTDDRPVIEFGFARNLGREGLFQISELRELAHQLGDDRPLGLGQSLDWHRIEEMRTARDVAFSIQPRVPSDADSGQRLRVESRRRYVAGDLEGACRLWSAQSNAPDIPIDVVMFAECSAEIGDEQTLSLVDQLRSIGKSIGIGKSIEADAILTRWHARRGRWKEALGAIVSTYEGYRDTPWSHPPLMDRLFPLASQIARSSPEAARRLFAATETPFSVHMFDVKRRALLYDIGRIDATGELCVRALSQYEPLVPWDLDFLTARWHCYRGQGSPRTSKALADLERFRSHQTLPLGWGLEAPPASPRGEP
ncbi:MAG: fused MFS/spermidine synthase, partial [Acidobacteriota bacterium]